MQRANVLAAQELFSALPRGTHNLDRELIVASQRGRLLDAVAACVGANGYAGTTVADVVSRARVSRKTFYENFADKEGAFLAAYELSCQVMIAQITEAATNAETWIERVTAGVRTYLAMLSREPTFARAFLVEVTAAGPRARRARLQLFDRFAELLRNPDETPDPGQEVRRALIAGINELAAWKVLDGQADELASLEQAVITLVARPEVR